MYTDCPLRCQVPGWCYSPAAPSILHSPFYVCSQIPIWKTTTCLVGKVDEFNPRTLENISGEIACQ